MTLSEATTRSSGNIGMLDRAIRAGIGMATIIASVHVSIKGAEAYPFIQMFATILVLTAIAGWDPVYAAYRSAMRRLTFQEYMANRVGNIRLQDRALRLGGGLTILFITMHFAIDGNEAYPIVKLFATIMVLTAIAGWDPLYAVFRSLSERLQASKNMRDRLPNHA